MKSLKEFLEKILNEQSELEQSLKHNICALNYEHGRLGLAKQILSEYLTEANIPKISVIRSNMQHARIESA